MLSLPRTSKVSDNPNVLQKNVNKHIVVGISGGVDSSVAALLLLEQGYQVSGLFMKNWEEDDTDQYCAALEDLEDAQAVCDKLGIPLHQINFSYEYWERVFTQFLHEYEIGLTPNPDILCNREIKFKEFLSHAITLHADAIATGHYAGISRSEGELRLLRGEDPNKDQSYFLYTLQQDQLGRTIFPLSKIKKSQVRSLAQKAGLVTSRKKDSTGICFIGERKFREFLSRYLTSNPGEIRRADDASVVGEHSGLMHYTIGQRQGLGIGGPGSAWYVVRKDIPNNIIYVAQGHDHPTLFSSWLRAKELSWVAGQTPNIPLTCSAKTRYRQIDQSCVLEWVEADTCLIRFTDPQRAITPGQSVVFYDGAVCLGGGIITDCEALAKPLSFAA